MSGTVQLCNHLCQSFINRWLSLFESVQKKMTSDTIAMYNPMQTEELSLFFAYVSEKYVLSKSMTMSTIHECWSSLTSVR